METEAKFALMEQEEDSALRAMDYTESQFEAWCLVESKLASPTPPVPSSRRPLVSPRLQPLAFSIQPFPLRPHEIHLHRRRLRHSAPGPLTLITNH